MKQIFFKTVVLAALLHFSANVFAQSKNDCNIALKRINVLVDELNDYTNTSPSGKPVALPPDGVFTVTLSKLDDDNAWYKITFESKGRVYAAGIIEDFNRNSNLRLMRGLDIEVQANGKTLGLTYSMGAMSGSFCRYTVTRANAKTFKATFVEYIDKSK